MPQGGALQQKLITELEDLIKNRPAAHGSHYRKQVGEKRALKKPPEGATLKFSLLPESEPEFFSLDELYDLVSDPGLAKKTLKEYTGKTPTQEQLAQLLSRVSEKYPELQNQVEPRFVSMADVSKRAVNDLFTLHETGNVKPFVDLLIAYPGFAPDLLEAAKKIKAAGYKQTPQNKASIDTLKSTALAYSQLPGGKAAHLETAAIGGGFSGPNAWIKRSMQGYVESPEDKTARERDELIEKKLAAAKAAKSERSESLPLRMREARGIEQEVESLKKSSERIAPMNATHDEAKALLRKGINRDSLNLAKQEIEAAGKLKIPRAIDPYLEKANADPADFVKKFKTDYAPVMEGYRQEARKDFLEHDLPQINSQFASKGAFFSGAREAALNKARADKEARIEREISKLTTHSHDEAMKHYHEHRGNALKSAEIAGNAHKAQQESHLRTAEQHRMNTLGATEKTMKDVAALSQIASAEQTQAQNAMNLRESEYREEQERPFIELAKKSAIAAEHPIPPALFYPQVSNPVPPNPFGIVSALLGQTAGLQKMGQAQGHAKGGLVRRKYAHGDSVLRAANELKQIQRHSNPGPHEQEMLQEGRALKNDRIDPMAQYLLETSAHQMANIQDDPLKTLGEGWKHGLKGHNAATAHNQESRQKYINLLGKINESRLAQQNILANYHVTMKGQEETQRYHNMANAETMRHHNMMQEHHTEKPVKVSATERNLENEARKDLRRATRMRNEVKHLRELITQTMTGPVPGFVKSFRPETKVDNKIRTLTNSVILDMHQGLKNVPRNEAILKLIESTKPSRQNYLETNQQSLDMMDRGAENALEHSIGTLLSTGWTPEKIEKRFKIKIPAHLLEEGEEEESDQLSTNEGSVKMMGPDGIEYEIPHSQIDAATQDGGRIIQ